MLKKILLVGFLVSNAIPAVGVDINSAAHKIGISKQFDIKTKAKLGRVFEYASIGTTMSGLAGVGYVTLLLNNYKVTSELVCFTLAGAMTGALVGYNALTHNQKVLKDSFEKALMMEKSSLAANHQESLEHIVRTVYGSKIRGYAFLFPHVAVMCQLGFLKKTCDYQIDLLRNVHPESSKEVKYKMALMNFFGNCKITIEKRIQEMANNEKYIKNCEEFKVRLNSNQGSDYPYWITDFGTCYIN